MMKKSVSESQYIATAVINGTVAFAAGTLANAALLWGSLALLGQLIFPLLSSNAMSGIFSNPAIVTLIAALLIAVPTAVSAGLAAILVLWVLRRLGSKLKPRQDKVMVVTAILLSLVFGFLQHFFLFMAIYSMAWGVYMAILLLGLPFTLAWLWATRRTAVRRS